MSNTHSVSLGAQLMNEVGQLLPIFLEDPIDREQSRGNAAAVAIEPSGQIYGRIFGDDKCQGRAFFNIACRKLIQVWITGYATGQFEELVYSGKLDEVKFGINRPDFIGWEGGVPFELADGTFLATAFSGFRGCKDVEILTRAAHAIPGLQLRRNLP